MCEQYNIDNHMAEIHSILRTVNRNSSGLVIRPGDKKPRQVVPVLSGGSNKIVCSPAIWGIDEDMQVKPGLSYNVCAEHVLHERRYRRDLLEHPAAIPASCFYEWKAMSKSVINQYKCHNADNSPLYLAGFYQECGKRSGRIGKMAAVLTTRANKYMMPYQYRMPVLLRQNEIMAWLKGSYVEYFLNREPFFIEVETVGSGAVAD